MADRTGKTLETMMQELLDGETVADIVAQFEFSSVGKHLSEEHNAVALDLLNELQKRLAVTTDPDERLTTARQARAAWHKVIRQQWAARIAKLGLTGGGLALGGHVLHAALAPGE